MDLDRERVLAIYGAPAPKGSMKCIGRGGERHQLVDNSPRTKPWRERVARAAREVLPRELSGPVGVEATFTVARPTSHYRVSGGLSAAGLRQPYPARRSQGLGGDVDKLARTVLDALEDAGVLVDDSQVVELVARKTYADGAGVLPDALDRPGLRLRLYPIEQTL